MNLRQAFVRDLGEETAQQIEKAAYEHLCHCPESFLQALVQVIRWGCFVDEYAHSITRAEEIKPWLLENACEELAGYRGAGEDDVLLKEYVDYVKSFVEDDE